MLSKVDILEGDDETFLAVEKEVFSQEFNDNLFWFSWCLWLMLILGDAFLGLWKWQSDSLWVKEWRSLLKPMEHKNYGSGFEGKWSNIIFPDLKTNANKLLISFIESRLNLLSQLSTKSFWIWYHGIYNFLANLYCFQVF